MEDNNKIDFNKYIDILFTAFNNLNITACDISDIVEIAMILNGSKEFEYVSSRLEFNNINKDSLEKHKYVEAIDDFGIAIFEVSVKDRKKIMDENKNAYCYIMQAIDKREMVKHLEYTYNGTLRYKYDNPDGIYKIRQEQACLYTDGKITQILHSDNEEFEPYAKTVKVDNATFSIFSYQTTAGPFIVEVRGDCNGDYELIENEISRLFNGNEESFVETTNDYPSIYKYKIH